MKIEATAVSLGVYVGTVDEATFYCYIAAQGEGYLPSELAYSSDNLLDTQLFLVELLASSPNSWTISVNRRICSRAVIPCLA